MTTNRQSTWQHFQLDDDDDGDDYVNNVSPVLITLIAVLLNWPYARRNITARLASCLSCLKCAYLIIISTHTHTHTHSHVGYLFILDG